MDIKTIYEALFNYNEGKANFSETMRKILSVILGERELNKDEEIAISEIINECSILENANNSLIEEKNKLIRDNIKLAKDNIELTNKCETNLAELTSTYNINLVELGRKIEILNNKYTTLVENIKLKYGSEIDFESMYQNYLH